MNKYKGFSLLEILVAVAIISAGLIFMIKGFGNNLRLSGIGEDYTTAVLLAKQKMAEIELTGNFTGIKKEGIFEPPFQRFSWKISFYPVKTKGFIIVKVRVGFTRGVLKREVILENVLLERKKTVKK